MENPSLANGSAHNILWSEEAGVGRIDFPMYFMLALFLLFCLVLGIAAVGEMASEKFKSIEVKRVSQDFMLFSFIVVCEKAIVWPYMFLTPYFVSGEMQIVMFVIFFVGPPLLSFLVVALIQKPCRKFTLAQFSELRKDILKEFGVNQQSMSCDSVSDLLFPVRYIIAHITFALTSLFIIIVGGLIIVVSTVAGLLGVCALLLTCIDNESEKDVSSEDLLQCILIHLISFSIPELVMVIMNMNLPSNPESAGLTIAFIVLVGLECLFGVFYLVKWTKVRLRDESTTNPSFTVEEVPNGSNGVQMTRPSTSNASTMPIRSAKQDAEFATTRTTGRTFTKTLDEDDDNDLEEPPWINPCRYQYGTSAQTSFQRQSSIHTSSLRHQPNGLEKGSDALECPICYITGNRKKVIVSCGHMLCEKCLEGLKTRTGSNLCPFCHREIIQTTDLYF